MKRLKLALLTLLLPIMAFAAETINFRDLTDNRNYNFTHVTTLTAIKGKKEQWSFQVSDLTGENPFSVSGTWVVENKPTWLVLITNITRPTNIIQFEGIVPTNATNSTNFKLTFTPTSGTALNQTYTISITNPQIQYQGSGNSWENGETLTAIKGKVENYRFRTSSELYGIWEEVETPLPEWLGANNSYINQNRRVRELSIRGLVPEDADDAITFKLRVTDDSGSVATKQYTINVTTPAEPSIETTTLDGGEVGKYYNDVLYPVDSENYTEWSIISGNLPDGLEFYSNNQNKGRIYGYPTKAGTFNFTVKAHNITGEDTKTLSITIIAASEKPEFTEAFCDYGFDCDVDIETEGTYKYTVPEGASYVAFGLNRVATEVKLASGTLPSGISIKQSPVGDGSYYYILSGNLTYSKTNNIYTFAISAKNSAGTSTQNFTLTITQAEEAPVISSEDVYPDEVYAGTTYRTNLYLESGVAAWSATGLPSGLALNPSPNYLEIKGIPTTAGNFTVKVTATNSRGSSNKTFTIKVLLPTKPSITIASLPDGKIGLPYEQEIEANTEFATWSVTGNLPPGLTLGWDNYDYGNGDVYENGGYSWFDGTPTTIGSYTFTVKATNAAGSATRTFTMNVKTPEIPTILTTTLPDAIIGQYNYHQKIEAADDAIWSKVSGSLPSGLTLSSNGYIRGTPSKALTANTEFTFTVKAENESGFNTKELKIKVINPPLPVIATKSALSGKAGQSLYIWFDAGEYTSSWTISESTLPAKATPTATGFEFDATQGVLRGKVTTAGTYTFTLKATNAGGSSEPVTFTLTITMPKTPVISISSLPSGTVGQYYEQTLDAGDYAEWSITSGSLPPGLELDYDGFIYGTPATAGTYTFTLKATNVTGSASKQISLKINSSSTSGSGSGSGSGSSSGGGTTPIISSQTTISNLSVRTTTNAIVLENLPNNANVDVYNLQGKRIYSVNSANSQSLQIQVPKGMYVVKAANQTLRAVVK